MKANGQQLSFNKFRQFSTCHTIKTNRIKFQFIDPEICPIFIFQKKVWDKFLHHILCMIFQEKSFSCYILFFFFFYLGLLSRTFTIHGTAGEGGGYLFNSSLPLPPASQRLRHQPGDYCRELTSAHRFMDYISRIIRNKSPYSVRILENTDQE